MTTRTSAKHIVVRLYTPHSGQLEVHESNARFRVVNCGRRFGKTTMAANDEMKFALDHAEVLCWWVAPTTRQARISYRLMKRALKDILTKHNDTDMRMELPNGSVIECRSCDDPDNLRGEGIHFLVVEEAAMIPDATWFSVLRPMLSDTNGRAMFISTPKGRNWFYTLFQRGLDPLLKDYESFTRPTSSNPYIDPKEIEDAQRDMPADLFEQEYLAVFRDNASSAFKGIDACITGDLCDPVSGVVYEIGYDVAKFQDFSVMAVLNTRTQHLDAYYRINNTDYTAQVDTLAEICTAYNDAHVLMDSTGVGAAVMEMVQGKGIAVDGYLYTNTSKGALISDLIVGIQHRAVTFPDIPILVAELRAMQVKYTASRLLQYEAPPGGTDDFVNALGLAYHAGKTAGPVPYALASASRPQQHLPAKHEAGDNASDDERERIARRQETVAQFLRDVHITGRFGR